MFRRVLAKRRLWLLALLIWVSIYQGLIAYTVVDDLRTGQNKPGPPLSFDSRMQTISGMTAECWEAGIRNGDVLEAVDGQAFKNMQVFFDAVNGRKPGDVIPVKVRSAKGTEFAVDVQVPALADRATEIDWILQLVLTIGLPLFWLTIGFGVAFRKPNQVTSWLILGMMLGLSGFTQEFPLGQLSQHWVFFVWWAGFVSPFGLGATWMVAFAVLFPEKAAWARLLWTVPTLLLTATMVVFEVGREISFASLAFLKPVIALLLAVRPDLLIPSAGVLFFVLMVGVRSAAAGTGDSRRRLRILWLGSFVSFAPLLVQAARAAKMRTELLLWTDQPACLVTLLFLQIFPLTLCYVTWIRRAMDLRTTLRTGMHYWLRDRGLNFLQMAVSAVVLAGVYLLSGNHSEGLVKKWEFLFAGFCVVVFLRPGAQRVAPWLDRQFFREDCEREERLREFRLKQRRLMDEKSLLETLAETISKEFGAGRATLLLCDGGELLPSYSTVADDEMGSIPESSGVVRQLKVAQRIEPIYFDDESNWIQKIHPLEQAPLRKARVELMLPLAAKDALLGVLALGRRRERIPYSKRDLRILDEIMAEAGVALENSRLANQFALLTSAELEAARFANSSPEAKADDSEQAYAPELKAKVASSHYPGIGPNSFGEVREGESRESGTEPRTEDHE